MAKPRTPRLKVFQARFGFFDTVVAATSRGAALRAWDTHQDLFGSGDAKIATDAGAVAAAREHPETPLQRAVGTKDPFRIDPIAAPRVDGWSKAESAKAKAAGPRADRSRLDRAEAALRRLEETGEREDSEFEQALQQLQARRSAARQTYAAARKTAAAAVSKARSAYRTAGGKD